LLPKGSYNLLTTIEGTRVWDIIGNEPEVALLQDSIIAGRWAHAYLIVGPEFSGKRAMGLQFAKALNCLSSDKPCETCYQCVRINDSNHVDILTIDIQKEASSGVENSNQLAILRDISRSLALTPVEGKVRVVIFENADRISNEAQNSCLKLLEEPPPNVVLMLLAANSHAVLDTLRSRCQLVTISPVSFKSMMSYLVDVKLLPIDSASVIARAARGLPGLADALMENQEWQIELNSKFTQFVEIFDKAIPERLGMVPVLEQSADRSREQIIRLLRLWVEWYRDILVVQYGVHEGVLYSQFNDKTEELSCQTTPEAVLDSIQAISVAIRNIGMNANIRLSLERLVISL
jgi:DNA polymerase-3 subunit delta'